MVWWVQAAGRRSPDESGGNGSMKRNTSVSDDPDATTASDTGHVGHTDTIHMSESHGIGDEYSTGEHHG